MPSTLPRFALDRTLAAPPGEFELRDGTPVRVRPIRPEDRERLQVGLHQLSAASRYHRFHATVSELSPEHLGYLTEVDQVNHLAWIALDPALPGEPAVGVARIEVNSGRGMYVRSLAQDLGTALGCGAYLSGLTRTAIGPLTLAAPKGEAFCAQCGAKCVASRGFFQRAGACGGCQRSSPTGGAA